MRRALLYMVACFFGIVGMALLIQGQGILNTANFIYQDQVQTASPQFDVRLDLDAYPLGSKERVRGRGTIFPGHQFTYSISLRTCMWPYRRVITPISIEIPGGQSIKLHHCCPS